MIFGKSRLEMRLGVFVLVGLAILTVFVLMIGDFKNRLSSYHVTFTFNFINGVKTGAPIRFAGLDIGQVQSIKVVMLPQEGKTRIDIIGLIRKDIEIPEDSQVWVNTLGLLGEKYIDIIPGKNYVNFIKPGGVMVGHDPVAMHEFGELAKSIAEKMDKGIGEFNTIATNINDSINRIKNEEGSLGLLLYDDKLYKNIDDLVMDIKKNPWKLFIKGKEVPAPKVPKSGK